MSAKRNWAHPLSTSLHKRELELAIYQNTTVLHARIQMIDIPKKRIRCVTGRTAISLRKMLLPIEGVPAGEKVPGDGRGSSSSRLCQMAQQEEAASGAAGGSSPPWHEYRVVPQKSHLEANSGTKARLSRERGARIEPKTRMSAIIRRETPGHDISHPVHQR